MKNRLLTILLLLLTVSISTAQNIRDKYGFVAKYYGNYKADFNKGSATYYVRNKSEFIATLAQLKPGQSIYIADNAVLNLTGVSTISVPANVTIGSGRRIKGSPGALIFSRDSSIRPLFNVVGPNVTFVGLRLNGPDTSRREQQVKALYKAGLYNTLKVSNAIQCSKNNLTVQNCEIWGWTHSGIFLRGGSSNNTIDHNYIHHNQLQGLGYGICLDVANAKIFSNVFAWNNHSVAATGRKGTSYEAYDNVALDGITDSPVFDMHGGKDRGDGTDIAGDSVVLRNNVIYSNTKIFNPRGTPLFKYHIYNNVFINKSNTLDSLKMLQRYRFMDIGTNSRF